MKQFIDKVTQNVKDISKGVVGQTKTTVTQGKMELELVQAKGDIKKLYTQLGEKVYQNRLYPQQDPGIEALYHLISEKEQEIIDLEKEVEAIREDQKDTFESVKRKVKKTWDGEGEEPKEPQQDLDGYVQMKFCDKCSIGNHPEAKYCIACGFEFKQEKQDPVIEIEDKDEIQEDQIEKDEATEIETDKE